VREHGAVVANCRVSCPCELCRIFASALRACPHPYPQTAQGRAAYWDGLIRGFAAHHGAELAARVFRIELETARSLLPIRTVATDSDLRSAA
jgi:hypothetical protein